MARNSLYFVLCLALGFLQPSLSSKCPLPWNSVKVSAKFPDGINTSTACPNGMRFPGDVTWPKDHSLMSAICVVYGYIPFFVVGLVILEVLANLLIKQCVGTRELSFLAFVLCATGLNELVFKRMADEPRPDGSCNYSCGMPSGHSTMALGFFTLLFLDSTWRVMPKKPMTIESAKRDLEENQHSVEGETSCVDCTIRFGRTVPLSSRDVLSHLEFARVVLFWGALLIPVPFTRELLQDHTAPQVVTGGVIGMTEACCWFAVVRFLQFRYNHLLGKKLCGGLEHTYALPRFEVRSLCVQMLAKAEMQGHSDVSARPGVSMAEALHETLNHTELEQMITQIDWYINLSEGSTNQATTQTTQTEATFNDLEIADLKPLRQKLYKALDSPTRQRTGTGATNSSWTVPVRAGGSSASDRRVTELESVSQS